MTNTRYNTKRQEQFFQPLRVKVGCKMQASWRWNRKTGDVVRASDRTKEAGVYIVDTRTGRIVDQVGVDSKGPYLLSDKDRNSANHRYRKGQNDTKANAINRAKAWATENDLPFSLSEDIVNVAMLTLGPDRECLICKQNHQRSFEDWVCNDCRADRERGRQASEGSKLFGIDMSRLIPYAGARNHHGVDREVLLASSLLMCAGVVALTEYPDADLRKEAEIANIEKSSTGNNGYLWFRTTPTKFKAMRAIVQLVKLLVDTAEQYGKERGSSILGKLVEGSMPVAVFDKERVR